MAGLLTNKWAAPGSQAQAVKKKQTPQAVQPVAPGSTGKVAIPKGERPIAAVTFPPATGTGQQATPTAAPTAPAVTTGATTPSATATPSAAAPAADAAPQDSDYGQSVTPDDTSVSKQMTRLLSRDNEYMQQAEAQGLKSANRRGLINSTAAVRAVEGERIRAALPIASQDAGQAHQTYLNRMNVGAQERQAAATLMASFESSYSNTLSNIMNNPDLPASARDKYTKHAGMVRDSNLRLVEQMYGIQLDWGGGGSGTGVTPTAPRTRLKSGGRINDDGGGFKSFAKQLKRLKRDGYLD